jgi:putative cell wall-binding protein
MRTRLVFAVALAAALVLPSSASAAVRVGENRALDPDRPIYGRDAVGLAVNPRDRSHVVAVYTDLDTLECYVARSFNRGRTWRSTALEAPPGYVDPPCTVGRHLAALVDQSIAFGKKRNVYVTFASAVADASGEPGGKSVIVAKSTNGGRAFRTGVVALQGAPQVDPGPDYTLPELAVKRGGKGRNDRVFVVASETEEGGAAAGDEENTIFARSDDGGNTWGGPIQINPAGQHSIEPSRPVVGADGVLYTTWRTRDPGATPGSFVPEGRVIVSRSTDNGQTWSHVPVANVTGYTYTGPPQPPFVTQRTFTGSAYPRIAADKRSGNVYLVYGNGTPPTRPGEASAADHFIHPDQDVWFQRSTDGGTSWSDPVRLNNQAPNEQEITQTRHPFVGVGPRGRVDIVWQDRRHWYRGCAHTHVPCAEARLGDTYFRYSDDDGASFSDERRISDRSTNNDVGFDYRYGTYWAYGPQTVPVGRNKLLVAWMDSRNGNTDTDTQDIQLARVNLEGSRRIPSQTVRDRGLAGFAVRLSKLAWPGGNEGVLAGVFATRPASRIVIVNKSDFAGALAGGVLGRAFLAPVLVSDTGGLPSRIQREVARFAPIGAYLVGGEDSLSAQVAADVAATGVPPEQIERIDGGDSAGDAALIAREMDRRTDAQRAAGAPAFDAAVVVNPASRHAAAVAVLAANRRLPVLVATEETLPTATADALRDLNIDRTLVVGTRRAVSDAVLAQLPNPQRFAGDDAVETSRTIADESRERGVPTNVVFATKNTRSMAAALMGAAVGRIGGLMLLTRSGAGTARRILEDLNLRNEVDHLIVAKRRR